jgi:hypothetical protein
MPLVPRLSFTKGPMLVRLNFATIHLLVTVVKMMLTGATTSVRIIADKKMICKAETSK